MLQLLASEPEWTNPMKLAIFDIDGTLTKTVGVDEECFVRAFADTHAITGINTNWAEYDYVTDSGITLQIFEEQFGRAPDEAELLGLKDCFVGLLREQYQINARLFAEIPGAAAMLARLEQESAWAVAIATGCWRASACLKLEAAGIKFDGLPAAFAEDGPSRERIVQAAVVKAAAAYQSHEFEKVVSIGDGLWDARTARQLGFAFLGVGSEERAEMLRRAGACRVIEDFRDFSRFFEHLDEARIPAPARQLAF